jgi:hypothetical protein
MKCKRTSDGRKLDYHTLQMLRQQAANAVRAGQAVADVASAFGLNARLVGRQKPAQRKCSGLPER